MLKLLYCVFVFFVLFTRECDAQNGIIYFNDTSLLYKEVEKNIRAYQIASDVKHQFDSIGAHHSRGLFRHPFFDRGVILKLTFTLLAIKYPTDGFQLFEVNNPNQVAYNVFEKKSSMLESGHFVIEYKYLIAYNPKSKRIRFVAGNFFLDKIADDFVLDNENKQSFYEYITIKCYFLNPNNIKFIREDTNFLYFSFISFDKLINIRVNKDNYDIITIMNGR